MEAVYSCWRRLQPLRSFQAHYSSSLECAQLVIQICIEFSQKPLNSRLDTPFGFLFQCCNIFCRISSRYSDSYCVDISEMWHLTFAAVCNLSKHEKTSEPSPSKT